MLATTVAMGWLAQAMAQGSALKIVDFLTGSNSNVQHQESSLISSRYDWAQAWEKNQFYQVLGAARGPVDPNNVPDLPVINFDQTQIIAIWGGNSRNVAGYTVLNKTFEKNADVIWLTPQLMPGIATTTVTRPYAFIQVSKAKNEIDVMVQVGVDGQGAPVWRRMANFPKRGS